MDRVLLNMAFAAVVITCSSGLFTLATWAKSAGTGKYDYNAWLSRRVERILGVRHPERESIVTALLRNEIVVVPQQTILPPSFVVAAAEHRDDYRVLAQACLAHGCRDSGYILTADKGRINGQQFRITSGSNDSEQWLQVFIAEPPSSAIETYINEGISSIHIIVEMMQVVHTKKLYEFSNKINVKTSVVRLLLHGKQVITDKSIEVIERYVADFQGDQLSKRQLSFLVDELKQKATVERAVLIFDKDGSNLNKKQQEVVNIFATGRNYYNQWRKIRDNDGIEPMFKVAELTTSVGKDIKNGRRHRSTNDSYDESELLEYNDRRVSSTDILMEMMALMQTKNMTDFSQRLQFSKQHIDSLLLGKFTYTDQVLDKLKVALAESTDDRETNAALVRLFNELKLTAKVEKWLAKIENIGGRDLFTEEQKIAVLIKDEGIRIYRHKIRREIGGLNYEELDLTAYNSDNISSVMIILQMFNLLQAKSFFHFASQFEVGLSNISNTMNGKWALGENTIQSMTNAVDNLDTSPAIKAELTDLIDKLKQVSVIERWLIKLEKRTNYDDLTDEQKRALQIMQSGVGYYKSKVWKK